MRKQTVRLIGLAVWATTTWAAVAADVTVRHPPEGASYVGPVVSGRAEVIVRGKAGVVDEAGDWVLKPTYARVRPFAADRFFVSSDFYGLDNVKWEHPSDRRTPLTYGHWHLIGDRGVWLSKVPFESIKTDGSEQPSSFWGQRDGKWQLFDRSGQPLSGVYDGVMSPAVSRFFVYVNHKMGLMDGEGTILVKPEFDRLAYRGATLTFQNDRRRGVFDDTFSPVLEPIIDDGTNSVE